MKKVHVFTSAAFNYIPKVRMLFQSLRQHHPEWVLHLALADELHADIDLSKEPFDHVIPLSELEIPAWEGWAFCHTIVELATAIKPFVLARLLKLPDAEKVVYLDPDTVAFSRLDDIIAALDESNIVLTPHQITPEKTLGAIIDNEICSLKHGIYNLGFIAVAANEVGIEFAEWWSERIYHFCRADIPNGLFTDQRWIDLVPAFFTGVAIMRSPRHNVAPWNLTTREMLVNEEGLYTVNGELLGFYHFTGFDSGAHVVMAAKNAGQNKAVNELIDWYTSKTKDHASDPLAKVAWAYGSYSDGTPIGKAQRVVYRERADLQRAFPKPFDATGYLMWWRNVGPREYPNFFNPNLEAESLMNFAKRLTPGYRSGVDDFGWVKFRSLIRRSILHPQSSLELSKRGWEVLKNEGISGVKRRLIG